MIQREVEDPNEQEASKFRFPPDEAHDADSFSFDREEEAGFFEQEHEQTAQSINNGIASFAERTEKGKENQTDPEARSFYSEIKKEFDLKMLQIIELFKQGKIDEAQKEAINFLDSVKNKSTGYLKDETDKWFTEYEENKKKATVEKDQTKRQRLTKIAIGAVDFVPVIGSAKMLTEGLAGKTMAGEELAGGKRILHTVEGAVFLAIDMTGLGAVASTGMKATRLFTRSAALMRKVGMAREIYMPVYKTGKFIVRHPEMAKLADKGVDRIMKARKNRKMKMVQEALMEYFTGPDDVIEAEFKTAA